MNVKSIIYIFILSLIAISCANIKDPSGGPGIVAAPVIEKYEPAMNTIRFSGNEIELEFSEYMKKTDVQESIFINPSAKMAYDWSGTDLTIEFPEGLDSNTTYSFQLGTDYTDHYGNKPSQAFSLVFSTGDVLDSGRIVGRLFDEKPSGNHIYAYNISILDPDTLDIRKLEPKYRTQLGTNGNFKLNALKPGKYRLFVVSDEFSDNKFTEGIDKFAAAPQDYIVQDTVIPFASLKIGEASDLTPPTLLDAEAVHEKMFAARFSESIDTSSIKAESFIIKSDKDEIRKISHAFSVNDDYSKWYLRIKQPIDTNSVWNLYADNAEILKDSTGNSMPDSSSFCRLLASDLPDTNDILIRSFNIKDSTENILINNYPKLVMSDVFEILDSTALQFYRMEDSAQVNFRTKITGTTLELLPGAEYLSNKWFEVKIDLNKLRCVNGKMPKDTIIHVRYKTEDIRNYVTCSGKIATKGEIENLMIVMIDKKGNKYSTKVASDSTWSISNLQEGDYKFESFLDSNGNGEYDFGNAYPFEYSEKFFQISKELTLKKRWDTEDVLLILEEL